MTTSSTASKDDGMVSAKKKNVEDHFSLLTVSEKRIRRGGRPTLVAEGVRKILLNMVKEC